LPWDHGKFEEPFRTGGLVSLNKKGGMDKHFRSNRPIRGASGHNGPRSRLLLIGQICKTTLLIVTKLQFGEKRFKFIRDGSHNAEIGLQKKTTGIEMGIATRI
jgi:hypothetical protein